MEKKETEIEREKGGRGKHVYKILYKFTRVSFLYIFLFVLVAPLAFQTKYMFTDTRFSMLRSDLNFNDRSDHPFYLSFMKHLHVDK